MWNKCLVLGAARSGLAISKLCHHMGKEVIIHDDNIDYQQTAEWRELFAKGVSCLTECPDFPCVDLVIKSPGIRYDASLVAAAIARGLPVVSEVEIASHFCGAPIIGITGTNGKTTTTTIIGQLLAKADMRIEVVGNIGRPLSEAALSSAQWLVTELSSFQLKGVIEFRPRIALCLNMMPAHLDYHGTFDDYFASKAKIFAQQEATDFAVLNFDDQSCQKMASSLQSQIFWFSSTQEISQGIFIRQQEVIWRRDGHDQELFPLSSIKSLHIDNVLAATAVAMLCQVPIVTIIEVVSKFAGIEHRLEFVTEKNGVKYYNDSKATNCVAVDRAMKAFTTPLIWIAGGLDRGIDFKELMPELKSKVKVTVAYGESAEKLIACAHEAQVPVVIRAQNLEEAVHLASEQAIAGDTVLLSPACASWDMFASFEERGDLFKEVVYKLNC